jgi:streptogramin lyase
LRGTSCRSRASVTGRSDTTITAKEGFGSRIGRITPAGVITEFPITGGGDALHPGGITLGPDGNLWFTGDAAIVRITPAGVQTDFSLGHIVVGPVDITSGPDRNLWFTEFTANRIGRITPAGVITEFGAGISFGASPHDIAAGPDGNLWFTENNGHRIGRITTTGGPGFAEHGIAQGAWQRGHFRSGAVRGWRPTPPRNRDMVLPTGSCLRSTSRS